MTSPEANSTPTYGEDVLIILPVRNLVLFPGVVSPVALSRPISIAGAQEAVRTERKVGFLLQRDADQDTPTPADLHPVGTVASVLRYVTAADGTHHLVVQGERRFRVLDFQPGLPFLLARVEYLPVATTTDTDVEARALHLKRLALEAIKLLPHVPGELGQALQAMESAEGLADLIASFLDVKSADKQLLLETTDLRTRLEAAAADTANAVELLFDTPSVLARLEGTGRVVPIHGQRLGLVGPPARACGFPLDVRRDHPFGPYRETEWPLAQDDLGDVAARARVRWQEIQASVAFLRRALDLCQSLADTPLAAPPRDLLPGHLAVGLVEAWRGEAVHFAVTGDGGRFRFYKVVDPSFHNWTGLALAMRGEEISDFPLCNKSFNLSYCGFDL